MCFHLLFLMGGGYLHVRLGTTCLHVRLGTTCLSDAGGGQKGTSDPLELKLQTIVTCHPRARKRRWVLWKISQDPPFTFFITRLCTYTSGDL